MAQIITISDADYDAIKDQVTPIEVTTSVDSISKENVDGLQKDLSNQDLSGLDLSGTDLKGTDLRGANLTGTNFYGCKFGNTAVDGMPSGTKIKRDQVDTLLSSLGFIVEE